MFSKPLKYMLHLAIYELTYVLHLVIYESSPSPNMRASKCKCLAPSQMNDWEWCLYV